MRDDKLNSILGDLLSTLPLIARIFRKKISKWHMSVHEDISHLHHEIIRILDKEGTLHIAEIASRLVITRPQMTHLIDKLVDLGLVERQIDVADRRAIKVALTDKARVMLAEMDSVIKSNFEETLSSLTDEEVLELLVSVKKLREIFSKLQ